MKIICKTSEFKKALNIVDKFVNKNSTLDSLRYIKIETKDTYINIIETDLSSGITLKVSAKTEEGEDFLIDSKPILQFIQFIEDEYVEIVKKDNYIRIETKKESINIKIQTTEDYPIIPKTKTNKTAISSEYLLNGIESVNIAVSMSDIKPELNSVCIYNKEDFTYFVATDTFRLAEKKIKIPNFLIEGQICIPEKTVGQIVMLLNNYQGTLEFFYSENQFSIENSFFCFTSRLVQNTFPNYQQIIPQTQKTKNKINVSDLLKAVKLSNVFSDTTNQIILSIQENKTTVSSENGLVGSQESIITSKKEGDDVIIKCNSKYVLDILNRITTKNVIFSCNGASKPCVVRPEDDDSYVYLVMPMSK